MYVISYTLEWLVSNTLSNNSEVRYALLKYSTRLSFVIPHTKFWIFHGYTQELDGCFRMNN